MLPINESVALLETEEPLCSVFGECGGCAFQRMTYADELALKDSLLKEILKSALRLPEEAFEKIVASPEPYHYRSRLDITVRKTRKGIFLFGFQSAATHRIVEIDACPISRKEISDFLPELKIAAANRLPDHYPLANVVVRTGSDGRVLWGGIGRRSLETKPEDYFWTDIDGKRVYYSLATFFQANHGILPALIRTLKRLGNFSPETALFDLYAGVGLFGVCLYDGVGKVVMIEESDQSVKLMRYNAAYHGMDRSETVRGKVEDEFPKRVDACRNLPMSAIIDPPRQGLSPKVCGMLADTDCLQNLFYLSCNPQSLSRDLEVLCQSGWKIKTVIPFDFFPRTSHLETLIQLKREK